MKRKTDWTRALFLYATISFAFFLSAGIFTDVARGDECGPNSIEINTASETELKLLNGIGDALAPKIIAARPFQSLDELETKVSGIGPVTLQKIKDQGCAWVDGDLPEDDEEQVQEEEDEEADAEPFFIEGEVEVPRACEVVDTDEAAHTFPEDDSPSGFLGICALAAAKETDVISAFEVTDHPDFGLFIRSVNEVAADSSSEFWALWHKKSGEEEFDFADCGIGCLEVSEGDELALILTTFEGAERDTLTLTLFLEELEEENLGGEEQEEEGEETESSSGGGGGSPGGGESSSPDPGAAVGKAAAFLQGKSASPDAVIALAAAGKSADVSFLKSFSSDKAIDYAKPILALTALGEDPRTYPNEDWIAKMKSFANGTQLGDPSLVNDDMWGILALMSAGVPANDPVIQNSKSFLLQNQNGDGGWAWDAGGDSDTNDTAVAVMTLLEVGMTKSDAAIQNAISYLKSAQNGDGGFPYDPQSPFGTDSDGNSTAWVIMAINKLGEDPKSASWTKNPNPVDFLLSLQDESGEFWWMPDSKGFGATTDALIALSGKSFPVGKFTFPLPIPDAGGGPVAASSFGNAFSFEEAREVALKVRLGEREVVAFVFVEEGTNAEVRGGLWQGRMEILAVSSSKEIAMALAGSSVQAEFITKLIPVGLLRIFVGDGVSLSFDKPALVSIPVEAPEGSLLHVFTRSESAADFQYADSCEVSQSSCAVYAPHFSWFVAVKLKEFFEAAAFGDSSSMEFIREEYYRVVAESEEVQRRAEAFLSAADSAEKAGSAAAKLREAPPGAYEAQAAAGARFFGLHENTAFLLAALAFVFSVGAYWFVRRTRGKDKMKRRLLP